jgi:hypothetical protein
MKKNKSGVIGRKSGTDKSPTGAYKPTKGKTDKGSKVNA